MKKTRIAIAACALMLGGSIALPTAGSAFSESGLEAAYGKPVAVVKMENGSEKRYYKTPVAYGATIYRMFEVKGSQAADLGLAYQVSDKSDVSSVAGSPKVDQKGAFLKSER